MNRARTQIRPQPAGGCEVRRRGAWCVPAIAMLGLPLLAALPDAPRSPAAAPATSARSGEEPPERVLVAPLVLPASLDPNTADPALLQVARSIPALIAEALSADRALTASLAHDLSPDTLESMGLPSDPPVIPDAAALAAPGSAGALLEDGGVGVVVFPSIEAPAGARGKSTPSLRLEWNDLRAKQEGSVVEPARGAPGLIDAAGRAAAAARREWPSLRPSAGEAAPKAGSVSIPSITSKISSAIEAWAKAGEAWNHGDVPGAEKSLESAVALDRNFDRARVDLAWIRLGQGRLDEAGRLAREAIKGSRLSASARSLADVIDAAATGDAARIDAVAARLEHESPRSPWGALASGLARNMAGEHHRAIAPLDRVRLHHPNDPALLHEAGIAALGETDYFEAQQHLERAAALWPAHDRIQLDLAEAKVRAHDLQGAREVLEAWGKNYRPGDPPVWGGEWSYEDPPPFVRSRMIDILTGSISATIEYLDEQESLLDAARAPVSIRLIVLRTMHDLQNEMYFGEDIQKLRWLNGARTSLARMKELIPAEEQERRPWTLGKLEAILRVREGRIPEAKALRDKIAASSSAPGFDAAALAEVEAAIAVAEFDASRVFEARDRVIAARGDLRDFYQKGEALAIATKWKEAQEMVGTMKERVETWSLTRRGDAILWSPRTAAVVPFVYSLGGVCGYWLGDVDYSRAHFGVFLAYFRTSDRQFFPYVGEALDRGSTPAW